MIRSLKETHSDLEKIQSFVQETIPSIKQISKDRYHSILFELHKNQDIFIREDDNYVITAIVTVFIETRITHGGRSICHAHDLVVKDNDDEITREMIDHVTSYAKKLGCKEVLWVCDRKLKTGQGHHPLEARDSSVFAVRLSN